MRYEDKIQFVGKTFSLKSAYVSNVSREDPGWGPDQEYELTGITFVVIGLHDDHDGENVEFTLLIEGNVVYMNVGYGGIIGLALRMIPVEV